MFSGHVRDLLQRVPDRVAQKRGKYFRAFNFPARKGTWRDRFIQRFGCYWTLVKYVLHRNNLLSRVPINFVNFL